MSTECYAMVRGSAIRVTGLGSAGQVPEPIQFATSKSVAKVTISEVIESGNNETMKSDQVDDRVRLRLNQPDVTVRYTADIDFLKVDPGVLWLVAGMPLVYNAPPYGFGLGAFGETPFGGDVDLSAHDLIGFDMETRRPAVSFALEIWSRLAGTACEDGTRQWGYTLFPFLKGGYLSGFEFSKGLVSFNLRGAQARRVARWGVGPHDLEGEHERLIEPVSGNTLYRQMLTTAPPPTEVCGLQQITDVIEGGSASDTTADIIDGEFTDTSVWVVEGGMAV